MPLCANNKVSRAGLHTGPAALAAPVFTPAERLSPSVVEAAMRDAAGRLEQTSRSVPTATRGQLAELLRAAQQEVDRARRMPHASTALAALERDLVELRHRIEKREKELAAHERVAGSAQRRVTARIDRLAAVNLGMGPTAATGRQTDSSPGHEQAWNATGRAALEAEQVLGRVDSVTPAELSAAKRDAQRALSRARAADARDTDIDRLATAVKAIQRAESAARTKPKTSPADARVAPERPAPESSNASTRPGGPDQWVDEYLSSISTEREIVSVVQGNLTYLYDSTMTLQDGDVDNRLVAVYGRSDESHGARDKSRMSGFPNPYHVDRGHMAARSFGGGYDLNLVPQDPALNRGSSEQGKVWTKLERDLANRAGTEFFVRPIYHDASDYPASFEFGVRLESGQWRVETFDNWPDKKST